jgi:pyrimidine operon attenuation protein/uracil phosphoribosyltransferase
VAHDQQLARPGRPPETVLAVLADLGHRATLPGARTAAGPRDPRPET